MVFRSRSAALAAALVCALATCGCSTLFKRVALPSPAPFPSIPPVQQDCVTGIDAQSAWRHTEALSPASVTVDSSPRGLQVEVDGKYIGATPRTTTPPYSNTLRKISVLNSAGGTDYQVCYTQTARANLTVFYNRSADTAGKITSIQSASRALARNDTAVRRLGAEGVQASPGYSGGAIEVRYRRGYAPPVRGQDIAASDAAIRTRIVTLAPADSIGSAIERLRSQPGVVSAEPVGLRFLKTRPPISRPTDPHFGPVEQWDMYQVQMLNGWAYTMGAPGVKIAVIDTGLDTDAANALVQTDLIPKVDVMESVLTPQCRGTQVVTNGATAVGDTDGHGTNVAGIAASTGNNAAGFAGMAWNVRLQIYKIFDSLGNACTSDEAKAIYDAVANGARVINLSVGSSQSGGPDQTEADAVAYAIAHNVFVVAAAGNERAQGTQNVDYPGAYPGVMAVGATGLSDSGSGDPSLATERVAAYSNAGPGLGVVAPGGDPTGSSDRDTLHWISNLYSTKATPPCSNSANCYAFIAGTSQATPHVSGAAALLLSLDPSLTPAQLFRLITGTADDINDPQQGYGRLDVYRALAAAAGDPAPPPYKPASQQFLAFAYTNSGAKNAAPAIVDVTFPNGVLVNPDGTFRIADLPTSTATFKIGVWYDANGDGVVDAGDRFAATAACTQKGPCAGALSLSPAPVTVSAFALP